MFTVQLKKKNIKLEKFGDRRVEGVIKNEYSLFRLLQLAQAFETYAKTENAEKYINLDFAQLYYLSVLDEKLSHILVCVCLESELKIKTLLIAEANKLGVSNDFLVDYIKGDLEYLLQSYPQDLNQILKDAEDGQDSFALERFLDLIMFGTFEKVVRAFYKQYFEQAAEKEREAVDGYLISIHNIRNKVAHNIPLLGGLRTKGDAFNSRLSAYLTKSGIKHRTLKTNLSREVVFDIVNVLYLYCCNQDKKRISANYSQLKKFCRECKKYKKYFINNSVLVSSFNFFESIIEIFRKPII